MMDAPRSSNAEENSAPSTSSMGVGDGVSSQPPPQYECPICLNWLQEPVLTSCGHRFCKNCIVSWLQQGDHCPVDNVGLRNVDLFPDNFTRREILQQRFVCPFSSNGCNMQLGPLELESHISSCKYNKSLSTPSPKLSKISCVFKDLGCNICFKNEEMLSKHLDSTVQTHLNLLKEAYSKLCIDREMNNASTSAKGQEAMSFWDPDEKGNPQTENEDETEKNSTSLHALVRALYERIVVLEQRNHEQDITIGNMSRLISATSNSHRQLIDELPLKFCFGTYLWRLENFSGKLDILFKDPSKMLYSQGFYTSPNGYRFCARLNSSPVQNHCVALHIHMMKSNNDDFLDWPFKGKISFRLINPAFPHLSQVDTMATRPDLAAFQRPTTDICTRGFGFATYISANDIKYKGFMSNDSLQILIKIQAESISP